MRDLAATVPVEFFGHQQLCAASTRREIARSVACDVTRYLWLRFTLRARPG